MQTKPAYAGLYRLAFQVTRFVSETLTGRALRVASVSPPTTAPLETPIGIISRRRSAWFAQRRL
ncbi:MAG: hypothetical protein NZ874_09610 [Fimbriimonadales bacterium]|nr:hypothetical protein [Fimbriimonadales bacterium]